MKISSLENYCLYGTTSVSYCEMNWECINSGLDYWNGGLDSLSFLFSCCSYISVYTYLASYRLVSRLLEWMVNLLSGYPDLILYGYQTSLYVQPQVQLIKDLSHIHIYSTDVNFKHCW